MKRDGASRASLAQAFTVALPFAVLALACGCRLSQEKPPGVGEVPAIKDNAQFVAGHVARACDALAVEKTPAAALALSHLRIAASALPRPLPETLKKVGAHRIEDEPVALAHGAALLDASRQSLSDHVAEAERKARAQAFAQAQAEHAANFMLVGAGIIGALGVASGVAFFWVRLPALIGSAVLLGTVSGALMLGARLVTHGWLVYALAGAFALALACVAFVVWRAYLAPPPDRSQKHVDARFPRAQV